MHEIPYIEEILENREHAPSYQKAFEKFIHFGYWKNKESNELGIDAFADGVAIFSTRAIDFANIKDNCKILDVGCGFGGMIDQLAKESYGNQLLGINIDPRQLEIAQQNVRSNAFRKNTVEFCVADAMDTGLAESSFDYILAIEIAFHLPNRLEFLKEMYRVLRPGGTLVLSEILVDYKKLIPSIPVLIRNFLGLIHFSRSLGPNSFPITEEAYYQMGRRCGFHQIESEDWSQNVWPTFLCLRSLHEHGNVLVPKNSLYSEKTLDLGASVMKSGFQRYTVFKFSK